MNKPYHYCTRTCEAEHKKKLAVERYGVKKCLQYGKEYVSKNKYFCSGECRNRYRYRYREMHPGQRQSRKAKPVLPPLPVLPAVPKVSATDRRRKEQEAYIRQNGLCGICKTPYLDCERMQSNFRIIPKGAKYVDGKIQYSPKYRGPECNSGNSAGKTSA